MEKKEIVYGRNPVLEYLRSLTPPVVGEILLQKNAHGKIVDVIRREANHLRIPMRLCEKERFNEYGPSAAHQGVVLILSRPSSGEDDESFLRAVAERGGVVVLLDQLTDPHNIGSIIRTTEVLGGDAVVIGKTRSPDINPTVVKSSAGATAYLRIITVPNIARFLDEAKKNGFWVIGCSQEGTVDVGEIYDLKPAVLVVGSEGTGMRRLTEEKCDHIVQIPVKGNISSLNASVAAGIILYELLR